MTPLVEDDRSVAGLLLDIVLGVLQMVAAGVALFGLIEWLTPWEVTKATESMWDQIISIGLLAWLWRASRERNRARRALALLTVKHIGLSAERDKLRVDLAMTPKGRVHR